MPGGAPRTVIPPKEELIELGIEMIQWLKNNPDAVHYTEWYSIEKGILKKHWDDMCLKPEFWAYYEQARNILASRHMKGAVNEGIAHRYLGMYHGDLRKFEREKTEEKLADEKELARYKAEIDANKTDTIPQDFKQDFKAFTEVIKDAQACARNKADISNRAE